MEILVKDLMTARPCEIDSSTSIDAALDILLRNGVNEIYVTDCTGRLIGVIPDYSLYKSQLLDVPGTYSVCSLLSRSMMTVSSISPVEVVLPLFRESRYRCLPVVDAGRLVGLIERRDLMRLVQVQKSIEGISDVEPVVAPEKTMKVRNDQADHSLAESASYLKTPKQTRNRHALERVAVR